jgi:hypothetical protein
MLDWCGFATFLFDAVTRLDAVTRRSRHFPSLISVSCLLAATVPPQYAATCPSQLPNSGSFVYVSTNGFDSSSCGSAEVGACLTLQQAVNRCNGAPNCVVVAQHGIYSVSTPVTISHQIQLFGSCRFTGESPNRYRTIVKGLPAFSIASNGAPVKLVGFTILANDAPAGSASIAMTVDKSNLSLDQTVIVSGTGGAGSPGVKGADGKPGVRGNNATVPQFGADGGPAVACADPGHTISGYGGAGAPYQVVDSTGGETHTTCTPVNSSIAQKGGDAPGAGGGKGGTNGGAGCDCVGGVSGNTNTPDGKQGDLGGLGPPGELPAPTFSGNFAASPGCRGQLVVPATGVCRAAAAAAAARADLPLWKYPPITTITKACRGAGAVRADAAAWVGPAALREEPLFPSCFAPQSLPTPVQTLLFRVQAALADTAASGEAAPWAAGAVLA